jgi:diguanylate cyclase (GGDEF)-like protein
MDLPEGDRGVRFPRAGAVLFIIGVVFAAALMFFSGVAAGPEVDPATILVITVAACALVAMQFAVQLIVLRYAGRAGLSAGRARRELEARNDQLWAINRLCTLLATESSRRSITVRILDFFIEEMGAQAVTFWQTDSMGAPTDAGLARARSSAPSGIPMAEPQRRVQARTAAREALIIVCDGSEAPRPMGDRHPQRGHFALFLPLPGSEVCEGVLEVHADAGAWPESRWAVLGAVAAHSASALGRGRHYDQLQERANEDYVTGLFNQSYMQAYLEQAINSAEATDSCVSLVFLDVDNFKSYNDTLGHGAGDRVLQTVADQLRLMTEQVGIVGRSGGDEFMIILPGHSRPETEAFVQAFQDWLSDSAPAVNGIFRIKVSCGFALFPEDAHSRHELLAAADARLYHSKRQNGRAGIARPGEAGLGIYGVLHNIIDSVHAGDDYARRHCERAAETAIRLAGHLGLSPTAQRTLRLAALLHDVGKIAVPDDILRKPGPLTEQEFRVVKHQLNIAKHLIVDLPNADEVRSLVLMHHERWDGSGYPCGLKGDGIPYLARILAVADAYSAITLDRPYRAALSQEDALAELRRVAGTQLDPRLVDALCEAMTAPQPGAGRAHAAPLPA